MPKYVASLHVVVYNIEAESEEAAADVVRGMSADETFKDCDYWVEDIYDQDDPDAPDM